MNRRKFVGGSILAGGSVLFGSRIFEGEVGGGPRSKIKYVRDNIPSFENPSYRGERYEDTVPDTLDIAERAKSAIHAITSVTDPDADHEVYCVLAIRQNPAVMIQNFGDWVQICEGMMEALPLLRMASGESMNDDVDSDWMKVALKSLGPDGLYYIPLEGRPWSRHDYHLGTLSETDPVWRPSGFSTDFTDESVTQLTTGEVCARALPTLAVYHLCDKNPMWTDAGKRMVDRLAEVAIRRDDYAFANGAWEPNAKVPRTAEMPQSFFSVEWSGRMIQGLSQFHRVSKYEPALELAGQITKYVRHHGEYFDDQARFLFDTPTRRKLKQLANRPAPQFGGHGHTHELGLLAMLEYATAANDRETMEYVRAGYEWAKQQNASMGVSPLVGWFPEWYVVDYEDSEACALADMLALAIKLSDAGVGDYWDDLDRWVRNQFAAQQLRSDQVDSVYRYTETHPKKQIGQFEVSTQAVERNVGAWSSASGVTEWSANGSGICHCCTGNSSRAVYYVWESMLRHNGNELRVNLLLNRASRWADIYSHIPYEGRVDIKMKKECRSVVVRVPEWVATQSPEINCKVNGVSRPLQWKGRYVDIGSLIEGDKATLVFPISERTVREKIGPGTFTVTLKGNTVVAIDPPGQDFPIYKGRERYRKGEVQWRRVSRFVPEEEIVW